MKRLAFWLIVLGLPFAPACAQPLKHPQPEGSTGHYVPGVINLLGYHECPPVGVVIAVGRVTAEDHELEDGIVAIGDGTDGVSLQFHPLNLRLVSVRGLVGDEAALVIRRVSREGS